MKTYPLFLVGLERRRCVVVGGGREALRKLEGLLECDASVTVIAREICEGISILSARQRVEWIARDYREGDLAGTFLVIVAERDAETRERIGKDAEAAGVLANVMDDPDRCSFVAGSVVRRGSLTVSISTSGCAPALAVRLRERLERAIGPEYADLLELLEGLRETLVERYPDFGQRRKIWYRLVDSAILEHLRNERHDLARETVTRIVGPLCAASTDGPPATPRRAAAPRQAARRSAAASAPQVD